MSRSIAIPLVIAAAMAVAVAGSVCSSRAGALAARFAREGRSWASEGWIQIAGAVVAVVGIFAVILTVIAEIWWLQGVRLP